MRQDCQLRTRSLTKSIMRFKAYWHLLWSLEITLGRCLFAPKDKHEVEHENRVPCEATESLNCPAMYEAPSTLEHYGKTPSVPGCTLYIIYNYIPKIPEIMFYLPILQYLYTYFKRFNLIKIDSVCLQMCTSTSTKKLVCEILKSEDKIAKFQEHLW